eukprot:m.64890 g.64890  ORF g.64890 m.64890 type:complete len:311 (-) comp17924_c0_seq2:180-1112(-)
MSSSTGRHDDWRGSRGERDGRGSAIDQMGARVNGGSMDEAEYRPRPRTATAPQPDRHHSSRSNHPPTARYPSGASTSSNRMESGAMRRDRGRRATDVASTNAPYDRRNRGSSAKRGRPNTAASSVPAAPPMLDASPMPGHAGHAAQPFPHRGDGNPKRKKGVELETDPVRLAARQKKIDYGKNTTAYDAYLRAIPKHRRSGSHPRTPDKYELSSKRRFDGRVKAWRIELHKWDPEEAEAEDGSADVNPTNLDDIDALLETFDDEVEDGEGCADDADADVAALDAELDELEKNDWDSTMDNLLVEEDEGEV